MTLMPGSRSACPTAASISSGIGGTMVLSCSGRFRVVVATGPAVLYSSVSNSGIAEAKPLSNRGVKRRTTALRLTVGRRLLVVSAFDRPPGQPGKDYHHKRCQQVVLIALEPGVERRDVVAG